MALSSAPGGLPAFWAGLPDSLRAGLLVGTTGKEHLAGLVDKAATLAAAPGPSQPIFLRIAMDCLTRAWLIDPLDGEVAGALAGFNDRCRLLPPALAAVARAAAASWLKDAAAIGPDDMLAAFPGNMAPLHRRFHALLEQGDASGLDALLSRPSLPPTLAPVLLKLRADLSLALGDPSRAEQLYRACREILGPSIDPDLAEALAAQGRTSEALHLLDISADAHPWLVSLILRLHDLCFAVGQERADPPGSAAVLLYSFNKARDLDETLLSLSRSRLGDARVWVLDNGSTDETPHILSAWQDRLGPSRLAIVTLPVNIGAPAARNWLWRLPEVRASDLCIFLDDDIALPPDWLASLGAAMRRYPDAGVWGCKAVDHHAPFNPQQVDTHLVEPWQDEDKFSLSNLHLPAIDHGQFNYLRPCVSVTGCCHAFPSSVLAESGDFDIRFNPSQFDDLDHDLRLALLGRQAVYHGHLAVRHKRRTGAESQEISPARANAIGNSLKLKAKYSPDAIARIRASGALAQELDLQAKLQRLAEVGLAPA